VVATGTGLRGGGSLRAREKQRITGDITGTAQPISEVLLDPGVHIFSTITRNGGSIEKEAEH
jgi:hypothetical protein